MGNCLFIRRKIDRHKTPYNPPEQVDNVFVSPGLLSAIITWNNPITDQNNSYVGVKIIRKEGSIPLSEDDGILVYSGSANTYIDEGLTDGVTYYYRFYSYNNSGIVQNCLRYVSLTAKKGYTWKKYKVNVNWATRYENMKRTIAKTDGSSVDIVYYTSMNGLALNGETTKSARYNAGTVNLIGNFVKVSQLNYGIGKIATSISLSRKTGVTSSGSYGYITSASCSLYHIDSVSKGDYIESVTTDSQDTYTNNAVNNDGYWYELQAS